MEAQIRRAITLGSQRMDGGQGALAEKLGVHKNTISKWLNKPIKQIQPDLLVAIYEAANLSLEELAGASGATKSESSILAEVLENTRVIKEAVTSGRFVLSGGLTSPPSDPGRAPLPDSVLDTLTAEGQKSLNSSRSAKSKKVVGDDKRSVG